MESYRLEDVEKEGFPSFTKYTWDDVSTEAFSVSAISESESVENMRLTALCKERIELIKLIDWVNDLEGSYKIDTKLANLNKQIRQITKKLKYKCV